MFRSELSLCTAVVQPQLVGMGPAPAGPASTRSKSNSGGKPPAAPTTRKKGAAAEAAAASAATVAAELANAKGGGGGGGSAVPGGGGGAVKGRDSGKTKKATVGSGNAAGSGAAAGGDGVGGSDNSYSVGRKRVRVTDEKLGEFYVMLTTYEGGARNLDSS